MKNSIVLFILLVVFTVTSFPVNTVIGHEILKFRSSSLRVDKDSPGLSTGKVVGFNLYTERINQIRDNGVWVNETREIDIWNQAMTQIEMLEQEWITDKWENKRRMVVSISINMADSSFRFLQNIMYSWTAGAWVLISQTDYFYDSNNYLTQVQSSMSMGGNMLLFMQVDFTNNSAGNPLTEITKGLNFQTFTLEDREKMVYTYLSGNPDYLETEIQSDWINGVWVDTNKTTYTRNSLLNELTVLYQDIYGGSNIVNSNFEEMTYNSSGEHRTQSIYKYWNSNFNSWDVSSRWTATYDASWNMTLEFGENFMNGSYVPSWRSTHSYNASGNVTLSQTEFYSAKEGWDLHSQSVFYYSPSSVSDFSEPGNFSLMQNYPNPFNPSTQINYSLSSGSFVKLSVFDILGNEVAELVNSYQNAGPYSVNFDASNLSSGIYFYKLQSGNISITKQMLLIK